MTKPTDKVGAVRMRIKHGRVMHRVETAPGGDLRSRCRRPHPVKGTDRTIPRASAPPEDWTDERYWYPDCTHCPGDDEHA